MRAKNIALLGLLWTTLAAAQNYSGGPDRLIIGGHTGVFRISYNGFDRIYDKRSGMALGASALVKIRPPYYAAIKYHQFKRDANVVENGIVVDTQHWKEEWYTVGACYVSYGERRLVNHFGFGLAFFKINETGPVSVFGRQPGKRNASGFFFDLGLEYRFLKYVSLGAGFELTSAGIGGTSGFEGSSVGGYLFSAGLNWFVF